MRVQLLQPPAKGLKDQRAYPPLGLMYLASNVNNFGFDGKYDVSIEIVTNEDDYSLVCGDADVYGVGIHAMSSYSSAVKLIKYIRKINSSSIIIVGGAFVTSYYEVMQGLNIADVYVLGEGEKVFAEILNCLYFGGNLYTFVHRGKFIENLDDIYYPARKLLPLEVVRHEGVVHHSDAPSTTILATRGCPFVCNFCYKGVWGRKVRYRSVDNVINEMRVIDKEYGVKWFRFPDDSLFINKGWMDEFAEKMKNQNWKWTALARAEDMCDVNMLKNLKDVGCKEIFIGVESGSQKMLDLMGKQTLIKSNTLAINNLRESGIGSCVYILFGYPGETEETVWKTINWLKDVRPDKCRVHVFMPFPGLDIWDNSEKYGVKIDKSNFDYWDFLDCETVPYESVNLQRGKFIELKNLLNNAIGEMGYLGDGWTKSV